MPVAKTVLLTMFSQDPEDASAQHLDQCKGRSANLFFTFNASFHSKGCPVSRWQPREDASVTAPKFDQHSKEARLRELQDLIDSSALAAVLVSLTQSYICQIPLPCQVISMHRG